MKVDVCMPVKDRAGLEVRAMKTDGYGRVVVESGEAKHAHTILRTDIPVMVTKRIGDWINEALDLHDEKATPKERRDRFVLSCRVQAAMDTALPVDLSNDDCDRIKAAADLITHNHLMLVRIHEAASGKFAPKPKAAPVVAAESAEPDEQAAA